MRIEIDYYAEPLGDPMRPCGARTTLLGQTLVGYGRTWEEAKARLLARVKTQSNFIPPPRETVEVPDMEEEKTE